jgi:hypothetical protein
MGLDVSRPEILILMKRCDNIYGAILLRPEVLPTGIYIGGNLGLRERLRN